LGTGELSAYKLRRLPKLDHLSMNPEPNPGLDQVRYELRATGVPPDSVNPLRAGIHSRGYLPHVKREGASYFVTFRLGDSLPAQVLLDFKRQQAEKLRALAAGKPDAIDETSINREFQRRIERYLDGGAGACYLRRPEIAEVAAESLMHFQGKQYVLDEWVVMPNHVHLILWPMPDYTLSAILRDRKKRIAREANLILGRTGQTFWQHESYEHWIRDEEEKAQIRRYTRNNPVIAKLCRSPEDWRWSSAYANACGLQGRAR
jgi:REP element-mobilizing transposase RayT